MERILFFNALQLLVSAYALLRGGAPERLAGAALLAAAGLTRMVVSDVGHHYGQLELGVLAIDTALLGVLLATALFADRYWIFWVTSLHALGTGAHFVKAVDPEVIKVAYGILAAAWSYPILLLLAAGTLRHRMRVRRFGHDLDWSRQGRR